MLHEHPRVNTLAPHTDQAQRFSVCGYLSSPRVGLYVGIKSLLRLLDMSRKAELNALSATKMML